MNNFTFQNPVKLIFGKGSIAKLAKEIPADKKIMVTFGGGSVKKNGVYDQVGAALKGKLIQSITLTITSSGAGSGSSSKKLTFCQANYQSLNTGVRGSAQVGATLGTLTGKFYSNTVTHTLNASSNAALFAAMKAYFEAGNSVLVLYNGETSSSSGYSSNYARVTSCTISVTYIDAVVWYRDGSTWRQCTVWYRLNGAWVQVVPYYNSGGAWVRV